MANNGSQRHGVMFFFLGGAILGLVLLGGKNAPASPAKLTTPVNPNLFTNNSRPIPKMVIR